MDLVCTQLSNGTVEQSYVDVNIFNHLTLSYVNSPSSESTFTHHSNSKIAKYAKRVNITARGKFIPAIMSTTNGIGNDLLKLLRRVALEEARKSEEPYPTTLARILRQLSFALTKAVSLTI
ncbi:hypothetical protein GJ496_002241 [Pomphorhynchus laevis]|nr:hypothetical protein GJ496_002241 [Pomphorhynchus laevis]